MQKSLSLHWTFRALIRLQPMRSDSPGWDGEPAFMIRLTITSASAVGSVPQIKVLRHPRNAVSSVK